MARRTVRVHLRKVLEERDLSIKEVGRKARVCYPSMLDLVHDRAQRVDWDVFARVCIALKLQPGDLLRLGPARNGETFDYEKAPR